MRPRNGIFVVLFFVSPVLSSADGTSNVMLLAVDKSFCTGRGWVALWCPTRKKSVISDVFERRRRAGERPAMGGVRRTREEGKTRLSMKTTRDNRLGTVIYKGPVRISREPFVAVQVPRRGRGEKASGSVAGGGVLLEYFQPAFN